MIKQITSTHFHFAILLLSLLSMIFAYVVEYVFLILPCPLCIYQRFPYLLLIMLSIIGLQYKSQLLYRYYLATITFAILIAFYHSGVERGMFEISRLCKPVVTILDDISIDEFKKMLEAIKPAMCNRPEVVIFGLSMAEWNLLLNIMLFTIVNILKFKFRKNASSA